MFLLKNRTTRVGLIKDSDYLDEKFNIDLSSQVSAIYLGKKFDENEGSSELLTKICSVLEETKIQLYRKSIKDGKIINEKII